MNEIIRRFDEIMLQKASKIKMRKLKHRLRDEYTKKVEINILKEDLEEKF
jgi:hypothetical protein